MVVFYVECCQSCCTYLVVDCSLDLKINHIRVVNDAFAAFEQGKKTFEVVNVHYKPFATILCIIQYGLVKAVW